MERVGTDSASQVMMAVQHYTMRSQLQNMEATMATLLASAIPPAVVASINGVNRTVPAASPPPAPRVDLVA